MRVEITATMSEMEALRWDYERGQSMENALENYLRQRLLLEANDSVQVVVQPLED